MLVIPRLPTADRYSIAAELTRYLLDDGAPDAWALEELNGKTARLRVWEKLDREVLLA